MTGLVSRVKVRVRGGGADGAGYELCEIKEQRDTSLGQGQGVSDLFFCDSREPKMTDSARCFILFYQTVYLMYVCMRERDSREKRN